MNRPVYSSDRKKIGFLRKTLPEYLVVKKGLVGLSSYLIPKSAARSVDKRGIRLGITAYEARQKYSHAKMKRLALYGMVPKSAVRQRIVYDRVQTLRYSATRNRLAAGIAFVSGILFLLSGYQANLEIFELAREQLVLNTAREFWTFAVIPVGVLALLSQLGGVTVLMGAGLFAANRINIGKFLVLVGTGQGLVTILINLAMEFWSGRWALDNNYVTWLTSTAAGFGILFAVIAPYVTKGSGPSIYMRAARFVFRRR